MAQFERQQVFQSMSCSPNACLHALAELGNGMAVARWSNAHDTRDYLAPSHHTLSCYLAGGTGTFRREQPGNKGAPDKLCILPAEHQSAWVINGEIQLAHLYIEQKQFALGAVALLDREPRSLQLAGAGRTPAVGNLLTTPANRHAAMRKSAALHCYGPVMRPFIFASGLR